MTEVLDYATPQTARWKRLHADWLFTILALLQASVWLSFALHAKYEPPIPGTFRWSLFAFAWRISQRGSFNVSLISCIVSTVVAVAAILPSNRRFWAYLIYMISALFLLALPLLGSCYLRIVLTGNWLSLMRNHEDAFDFPSDSFEFMQAFSPVFLVLILRLLIPRERFVGR